MARDHAEIDVHIWQDNDYRDLSLLAKLLYVQLFSQSRLTYAGVLDLAVKRWSQAHGDVSVAQMRGALAELDAERFVVVDQDTEEVLVRSFIRRDGLWKQPNVLAAALRQAFEIESPILRAALAAELRRLPVEVTGEAPAVAATALEAGLHEMPPAVKAALAARRRPRTTPDTPQDQPTLFEDTPPPPGNPSPNPSGNPSPNPSAKPLGEGSRERETGEPCLSSGSGKVGVPAPAGARTREAPAPEPASVRQRRRGEARRLVTTHTPKQPRRVLDRLTGEVIGLLADGVEAEHIAAGLRIWAAKTLTVSLLPELVGEYMRAHVAAGATAAKLEADTHTVATFERVRASALSDAQSPIQEAVCGRLPAHATPEELDELLREAGTRALAMAAG